MLARTRGGSSRSDTRYTVVSFHAHPDDEALLTGGTLAKLAAEGHRVVLVTATRGERGLAGRGDGRGADLARVRLSELDAAAKALGCARVVCLEYADSGLTADPEDRQAFSNIDVEPVASRLAEILRAERADVLTVYDRNGGYGHPDHVQVYRVGTRAAQLAGTPVVLEATVSAPLFQAALKFLRIFGHWLGSSAPLGTAEVFAARADITHRIDVRQHLAAKRAALAAHASQRRADDEARVLDRLLRLPKSLFALVFGHEWFVEQGRGSGRRQADPLATLRARSAAAESQRPVSSAASSRTRHVDAGQPTRRAAR